MVKSLLEGALIGAPGRGEVEAGEELLCEHVCLENEACIKVVKLVKLLLVVEDPQGNPTSKKGWAAEAVLGVSHGNGRRACPLLYAEQPGSE